MWSIKILCLKKKKVGDWRNYTLVSYFKLATVDHWLMIHYPLPASPLAIYIPVSRYILLQLLIGLFVKFGSSSVTIRCKKNSTFSKWRTFYNFTVKFTRNSEWITIFSYMLHLISFDSYSSWLYIGFCRGSLPGFTLQLKNEIALIDFWVSHWSIDLKIHNNWFKI
jgi:hypothetical protein